MKDALNVLYILNSCYAASVITNFILTVYHMYIIFALQVYYHLFFFLSTYLICTDPSSPRLLQYFHSIKRKTVNLISQRFISSDLPITLLTQTCTFKGSRNPGQLFLRFYQGCLCCTSLMTMSASVHFNCLNFF